MKQSGTKIYYSSDNFIKGMMIMEQKPQYAIKSDKNLFILFFEDFQRFVLSFFSKGLLPAGGPRNTEFVENFCRLLLEMGQPDQSQYAELTNYINNYIKPNDRKAWLALFMSFVYQAVAVLLIQFNLKLLGWTVHTLNMVRFFIQFHDMAHFSYFESIRTNKIVGHIIGIYTHFPFDMWRDGHNFHHKHFGNLDKLDLSQTILFTKGQYQKWSTPKRIMARIFRQPIIFFFVTIQLVWFIGIFKNCITKYGVLSSAVIEKIFSAVLYLWIFDLLGLPALELYLSLHMAQAIGTILFHLQHSVNVPYRQRKDKWNFTTAALEGSTYLEVPKILRPFTNGIEYHHIHHLNTNVASYVIQQCHQNLQNNQKNPRKWDLFNINRVDLWLAFKSLFNVMLDEQNHVLVPFSYTSL